MRVEPELLGHPKFLRLKRIVGDGAMEYLVKLWGHCQGNQRGEFWPGADAGYVEMVCGWDGEMGVLYRALVECGRPGFIRVESEGLRIHDWDEMNPQFVKNWHRNPLGRKGKNPTGTQREPNGSGQKTAAGGEGSEGGSDRLFAGTQREPNAYPNGNPTGTQREATALNLTKPNLTTGGDGGTAESSAGGTQREPNGNPMLRFDLAQGVIGLLNGLTGAQFRGTHGELTLIAQCLARVGQDAAGVERMVRRQVALWQGDPKTAAWLRPGTLFDDQKFDGYYAQRDLALTADKKNAPNKTRPELIEELTQARSQGLAGRVRELETMLQTA